MTEDVTFIEHLNEELRADEDYTREDVFNTFKKYVANKDKLQKAIDFGLLHYDYAMYKRFIEGTLFEDGLSAILCLYNSALEENYQEGENAFKDSYSAVARGFASQTQSILTSDIHTPSERLDLFSKTAFQFIGDNIENSLKPFLEFLDVIYCISHNKPVVKKKLGITVNNLISYNDLFKALYKTLFLDVTVSQWRNIANHGDYSCTADEMIRVCYSEKKQETKYLSRQDVSMLLNTLDVLMYMHKTAYTLISIDHIGMLSVAEKYHETTNDDIVMQIVESSYAYGLEVFEIEKQHWNIAAQIRKKEPTQQDLKKYCSVVATFLSGKKFSILIYNGVQVEYQIIYNQNRAEINRYVVHSENLKTQDGQNKGRLLSGLQKLWGKLGKSNNIALN